MRALSIPYVSLRGKEGFSLVELSIVLVILGLLTGGILSGQALIRAAQLRSVASEYQKYVSATQAFRDRYMALPGDMPNAAKFWGAADNDDGLGSDCFGASVTTTATCNGNGNGSIDSGSAANEQFSYWKHLANAGLIEGSYTGIAGSAGVSQHVIGQNCPASKLSSAGWAMRYRGVSPGGVADSLRFAMDYGNEFDFGAANPGDRTYEPALNPEEAWNIDTKLDDGKPASGRIIAVFRTGCVNGANNTDTSAPYNLTNTAVSCALFFPKVF